MPGQSDLSHLITSVAGDMRENVPPSRVWTTEPVSLVQSVKPARHGPIDKSTVGLAAPAGSSTSPQIGFCLVADSQLLSPPMPCEKSVVLGTVILITANLFVPVRVEHPVWMAAFLLLTATSFCLFGFILGIWARSFEQLNFIPMLVITPLTFLGGAFYSIQLLPEAWRTFSLFNPVVYLINGFRWTFYGVSDVPVAASFALTAAFFGVCLAVVTWIFRTGYRLKT